MTDVCCHQSCYVVSSWSFLTSTIRTIPYGTILSSITVLSWILLCHVKLFFFLIHDLCNVMCHCVTHLESSAAEETVKEKQGSYGQPAKITKCLQCQCWLQILPPPNFEPKTPKSPKLHLLVVFRSKWPLSLFFPYCFKSQSQKVTFYVE